MSHQIKHLYEFGPFRLDVRERLLLREDESVSLTPKAFDLLLALVERHGRLLEKDELLKLVWPDTFVEEANLSYNISLIRKALTCGENGQKYIETVPKRGYRFVAVVREMGAKQAEINKAAACSAEEEASPETLTSKVRRHRKGALLALTALVIAFGGIGFGLYKFISKPQTKSSGAEPKVIPFTSFPGNEDCPTFSPDGNQIAFVWDGGKGNNADIYVKMIDGESLAQLTTNSGADTAPAWSPDGRHIAFVRSGKNEQGIFITTALGGSERALYSLPTREADIGAGLAWSLDGKLLAFSERGSRGREPNNHWC